MLLYWRLVDKTEHRRFSKTILEDKNHKKTKIVPLEEVVRILKSTMKTKAQASVNLVMQEMFQIQEMLPKTRIVFALMTQIYHDPRLEETKAHGVIQPTLPQEYVNQEILDKVSNATFLLKIFLKLSIIFISSWCTPKTPGAWRKFARFVNFIFKKTQKKI